VQPEQLIQNFSLPLVQPYFCRLLTASQAECLPLGSDCIPTRTETLPPKLGTLGKYPLQQSKDVCSHHSVHGCIGGQGQCQKMKRYPDQKGKMKSSFFLVDDMIVCIENPRRSTRKLLKLVSVFSKVSTYKVIYKTPLFLYILPVNSWKLKYLRKVPFTVAPKKHEILRYKPYKYVHNLYATNHKILMKEIKGVNKRRGIPCSWIIRLNIIRQLTPPKLSVDTMLS